MRVDEFKRIKLRILKNNIVIFEGNAEEVPDDIKCLEACEIAISPGMAKITIENEDDSCILGKQKD